MQISVVKFKDLNPEMRIDAEYYRADVLNRIKILNKKESIKLGKLVNFVVGPFGSTVTIDKYVNESNHRYIRNKDINDFIISDKDAAFIPESIYSSLKQYHIKEKDILLTVVGTLGKAAIALKNDSSSIFSCKSTLLRTKSVNPYYLITYLNSPTGQLFTLRGKRGAIQEGLNLSDLKEIEVFLPSKDFQDFIERIVQMSFTFLEKSNNLYARAQTLLLFELGLSDWKPKYQLSFVKNYSEIQTAERLDAEYFQPMYREVEEHLISKCSAKKIGEIDFINVTTGQYSDSYTNEKIGLPFIRGTNLSMGTIEETDIVYIDPKLQIKSKKAKEGDVVVTRVGTIGLAARIPKKYEGGTISDNLIRLRFNQSKLNSFFLATYLSSILGQNLMIGNSRGSVQQRLNQETLKEIVVPLIPTESQENIASLVKKSEDIRNLSKNLLEIAKKAVEIAIEKDEETATKWLDSQIEGIERDE